MAGKVRTKYGFDGYTFKDGERVGLPYSPSCWVGEPKYREVSEILITFGGGMGGSNWKIYTEPVSFEELINNDGFLEVNNVLTSEKIIINPKYIVSVQNLGLAVCGFNNKNSNFKLGYYDLYFLTSLGARLNFINEHRHECRG